MSIERWDISVSMFLKVMGVCGVPNNISLPQWTSLIKAL